MMCAEEKCPRQTVTGAFHPISHFIEDMAVIIHAEEKQAIGGIMPKAVPFYIRTYDGIFFLQG